MQNITHTKLYAVWTNTDLQEGRGKKYVNFYCLKEATAKRLANRNYIMGTDSPITVVDACLTEDGAYIVPNFVNVFLPSETDLVLEQIAEIEKTKEQRKQDLIKSLNLSKEQLDLLGLLN